MTTAARIPILEVANLSKSFRAGNGQTIHAVRGVSFQVRKGEALGLVGESGSGKTTVARCVLRLEEPTGGRVTLDGIDMLTAKGAELKRLRRRVQMIFQDPYSSLNPRLRVEQTVGEGLIIHKLVKSKKELQERVRETLEIVGLNPDHGRRFPSELSGGQRQRVGIARALAVGPELLVCDEPVSSLDVSIRAQIINLFRDLQQRLGVSLLFIGHDLAIVRHLCETIAVMSQGEICELGSREQICGDAQHPYTRALLKATPIPDPIVERARRAGATAQAGVVE
jgi:ABC-type oligopeptide transport system ATPase subunit